MKSVTFYRLLLGLPYLVIIPGFITLRGWFSPPTTGIPDGTFKNIVDLLIGFWGITGVFWIIPYTLFTIGLLLWSFGKSNETIRTWYTRSPYFLMMLSPFFFIVIMFSSSLFSDKNVVGTLAGYGIIGVICSIPLSLIYGFFFVQIGLLLHSILFSVGFIKDEPPNS